MSTDYEAPAVAELGDFAEETGEWFGPHDEQILLWEDYSA
ncbi:lasso RiPP family leader peptide-containing protein [Streptomyces caeruleatus]|nr:lasso RiPP family leader peptide-containing protein [Streptomyces caeruleatus]